MVRTAVLARVNGIPVLWADLIHRLRIDGTFEELAAESVRKAVVLESARQMNLKVTDEELQQAVDEFRETMQLFEVEQTEEWLRQNGLTLEDFEGELEYRVLERIIRESLATEEAVQRLFHENRTTFDRAEISRILVAKNELAQELMHQIAEEEAKFEDLAERFSIDPKTREQRGRAGWVCPADLDPVCEPKVFTARPGDIVGPFSAEGGYEILRVERIRRAELSDETRREIVDRLYQEWLQRRLRETRVEFEPPDLPGGV